MARDFGKKNGNKTKDTELRLISESDDPRNVLSISEINAALQADMNGDASESGNDEQSIPESIAEDKTKIAVSDDGAADEPDDFDGTESIFDLDTQEDEPEEYEAPKMTVGRMRSQDIRRKKRRTERENRIRERRRRISRFITACIIAVCFVASALLAWFLLQTENIEVQGNERYSDDEIISVSKLKTGRHMWLNNIRDAEMMIEEDPYIADAVITRVYPDTIRISIDERHEAAVFTGLNVQAVIDSEGYVLYIGARAEYNDLIKVSGMSAGGFHINQRLGELDDFNSRTLITMLGAVYDAGIESEIDTIDISNPLSINMLTRSGLTLHVGQPEDLQRKLNDYLTVLPVLRALGNSKEGTLDLSAKGDPVYSPPTKVELPDDGGETDEPVIDGDDAETPEDIEDGESEKPDEGDGDGRNETDE